MMLLTEEYRTLQRELHSRGNYGISSGAWAQEIGNLATQYKMASILDYGSGQGQLKAALGAIVTEYDPAIPGKDGEPQPADLVACTDVLEHIEPDLLDNVLEHIRTLAKHYVFLVIATTPAGKTLADGRNAHLIVEGEKWWRARLDLKFDVKTWDVRKGKIIAVAKPFVAIGEIKGKGAVSDEVRNEQTRINCGLVTKRIKICNPLLPNKRVAIIMCYGPSLEDTWRTALMEKEAIKTADIVSVSGAHDYLVTRRVIPKYHIECDPRKHKADMIQKPHRDCTYLMASCVHPDIINRLLDRKRSVRLWHLNNGDGSYAVAKDIDREAVMVGGGGSVGLRAIPVMMAMGYRRFIVHGMDCSYKNGHSHAGFHSGKKKDDQVEIRCGDQKFITSPILISYLRNFDDLRKYIGDPDKDPTKIEIILRGDGLLQHALKVGGAAIPGPMPENQEAA